MHSIRRLNRVVTAPVMDEFCKLPELKKIATLKGGTSGTGRHPTKPFKVQTKFRQRHAKNSELA
jgi:hypothetical protein